MCVHPYVTFTPWMKEWYRPVGQVWWERLIAKVTMDNLGLSMPLPHMFYQGNQFTATKTRLGWPHSSASSPLATCSLSSRCLFLTSLCCFSFGSGWKFTTIACSLATLHHSLRFCATVLQSSTRPHYFKSLVTMSFQRSFCPPAAWLPSTEWHVCVYVLTVFSGKGWAPEFALPWRGHGMMMEPG